jgi:hypothetical protein
MLRALVVAIAVLMAVGCGAPAQEPEAPANLLGFDTLEQNLEISPEFPEVERAEIVAAFAEWQFATGGSYEYAARPSVTSVPWRVVRGPGKFLGQADHFARVITINSDGITPPDGQPFRAEAFHHIALHEMGHAGGIRAHAPTMADEGGHIPGTVMDAHKELGCIDPVGLGALCELRGCAEMRPTCE